MFFEIENCAPDALSNNSDAMLALSNLIKSSGMKKNLVYAKKEILNAIIDSNLYGEMEKRFAKDIIDMGREVANIKNSLLLYVIVDFEMDSISIKNEGNTFILRVGYKYFSDFSKVDCVALLSENTLDSIFYLKVAEYFAAYVSPLNLKVRLEPNFGGGSQTKSEFDKLALKNKLALCIVDSDRRHPKGAEGDTSSAFTSNDKNVDGLLLAKVIDVHEAESLVPLGLIEKVAIEKLEKKVDLCDEIKIYLQKNYQFAEYFDFKKGMSLKEAITLDEKYGLFWLDILSVNNKFSKKDCFRAKSCHGCNTCPRVDGFGENLFRHVVFELENMHIRHLKTQLDGYLLKHWHDIGMLLMSWGCSASGRVVRS